MNIKNILSLVLILSSCSLFGAGRDARKEARAKFKTLCVNGPLDELKKFMSKITLDYSDSDESGCTLLVFVFKYGNSDSLKHILDLGFPLSDEDRKILEAMVSNENPKIKVNLALYDLYLNKASVPLSDQPSMVSDRVSRLLSAIISNNQDAIKLLVSEGNRLSDDEKKSLSGFEFGLNYYNRLNVISNK